ncbi:MAG: hypothetical protein IJC34_06515 [Lentisphaeria bacterium]|nr:hypothetical protein [Lentisphaeria bacterium]
MKWLDLNGIWSFAFQEKTAIGEAAEPAVFPDWMCVPGAFDALPAWYCRRGTAWYRREFEIAEDCTLAVLCLEGMGLRGRFFVDGREIGFSELAYSPLEIPAGPLKAGRHVLLAAVDNTFEGGHHPGLFQPFYDFYAFGGFYGGVKLKMMQGTFALDRVLVRTLDHRTGRVRLSLEFLGDVPEKVSAVIAFDHAPGKCYTFSGRDVELDVPDFRLWSPEDPALHTVTVSVEGAGSVTETFGIREIKACGTKLFLNGKELYLRGFNRHESSGISGGSSSESLMLRDLQNLKNLHCNFVRGAHYTQNPRFLDLCDRMGILVWDETLGWNNTAADLADPGFRAMQVEQMELMIRHAFNHPSIIIWGFLNEFACDTPEGEEMGKLLCDTARAWDSGRLVTFACSRPLTDVVNQYTDLVAYNTYPGWIPANEAEMQMEPTESMAANQKTILQSLRSRYPEKPIMVSEMGTCGIYGQHDEANAQWTEEFQAEYLESVIRTVFGEPDLCGLAIWQFCDAKSFLRKGSNIRCKPLAQNLAGVFDMYRRPKLSARIVETLFAEHERAER